MQLDYLRQPEAVAPEAEKRAKNILYGAGAPEMRYALARQTLAETHEDLLATFILGRAAHVVEPEESDRVLRSAQLKFSIAMRNLEEAITRLEQEGLRKSRA